MVTSTTKMIRIRKVILWLKSHTLLGIAILFSIPIISNAQSTNATVRDFLSNNDFKGLVGLYNSTPDVREDIEDAFACFIDWNFMTYEDVLDLNNRCTLGSEAPLKELFQRVLWQKESEIVAETSTLTAEQASIYTNKYPKRKQVVDDYLAAMFSTGLDKLSFDELLYLDSNLPANDSVKQALNLQKNKSFAKVKGAIDTYCNLEAEFIDKLIFILEYRSWQYLIARHKQVVNYYSQVGIVSDYVYDIVEQYNGIVRSCFSSGDLNRQLQKEVTAYSTAINNARARYTALANLTGDYPKFNIKLPSIGNFPIKSNMEIAGRIPAAREDFVSSRQTADAVSSIASWFVGGLASAIGKGLFDIYAVDELAESEYKARYAYIEDVYNQLEAIFLNYFNQLEKSTRSQMLDNQKIFKSYVNKQ